MSYNGAPPLGVWDAALDYGAGRGVAQPSCWLLLQQQSLMALLLYKTPELWELCCIFSNGSLPSGHLAVVVFTAETSRTGLHVPCKGVVCLEKHCGCWLGAPGTAQEGCRHFLRHVAWPPS